MILPKLLKIRKIEKDFSVDCVVSLQKITEMFQVEEADFVWG